MIERKDWKGLNFQEIENNKQLIEEFDDYIPLILTHHISNTKRTEYLRENRLYEKIVRKSLKERMKFKQSDDKTEWLIDDMLNWVKRNSFFECLVNVE